MWEQNQSKQSRGVTKKPKPRPFQKNPKSLPTKPNKNQSKKPQTINQKTNKEKNPNPNKFWI